MLAVGAAGVPAKGVSCEFEAATFVAGIAAHWRSHVMTIEDLVPLTNGLTVIACGSTLVCDVW